MVSTRQICSRRSSSGSRIHCRKACNPIADDATKQLQPSPPPSPPLHHDHDDDDPCHNLQMMKPRNLLERIVGFDKRFSLWVHEQGLGLFFYVFLRTLEFSADGVFLIPCTAATFLAPRSKLTPELRAFFFNLFMAFQFDLIFVSIVKQIVRRPRPEYNRGHFINVAVDRWSFPSGHSTRALMGLTFFWLYIPMWQDQAERVWVPFLVDKMQDRVIFLDRFLPTLQQLLISGIAWVVHSWAVATTTSRIILGRHFFCDVIAGSLLGVSESIFAHYLLAVPGETVEYIHQLINGFFANMESFAWRIFHERPFSVHDLTIR